MLRVKIPQGLIDSRQLRAFADVAERWSRGFGHITTRQNLQFHFIPLADVPAALDHLADAGLTTREACGNSVRNITACPYAGVSQDEAFDVTPYAEALTRYFLRHPLSLVAAAQVQDRASRAAPRITRSRRSTTSAGAGSCASDGVRAGSASLAGGGTATMARSGFALFDFAAGRPRC